MAKPAFDAKEFMLYCTERGRVDLDGTAHTLLFAPMGGFYTDRSGALGKTQLRLAYVESPEKMQKVPKLFAALFEVFQSTL